MNNKKIEYLEAKINEIMYEFSLFKIEQKKYLKDVNCAYNYLINSNFLLNESKKDSYTCINYIINSVNKWIIMGNTSSYIYKGQLSLTKNSKFYQEVDSDDLKLLLGKTLTLSFCLDELSCQDFYIVAEINNGSTITSTTKKVISAGTTSLNFNLPSDTTSLTCSVKNFSNDRQTIKPIWSKLEIGNIATNYYPPFMAEEILRSNKSNIMFYELVYDMSSPENKYNWGYLSGIRGGASIPSKDFSKYKELKIYVQMDDGGSVALLSLNKTINNNVYGAGVACKTQYAFNNVVHTFMCTINAEKTSFSANAFTDINGSNYTACNNNDNYKVYKIEGIF